MVKGQYNKFRELVKEQFSKITDDIKKHVELEKLTNDQIWDLENKETIYPQYYEMPKSSRSNWKHLDVRTRAIFVLRKSRAFTDKEIGDLFGITKKTVYRIFNKAAI